MKEPKQPRRMIEEDDEEKEEENYNRKTKGVETKACLFLFHFE